MHRCNPVIHSKFAPMPPLLIVMKHRLFIVLRCWWILLGLSSAAVAQSPASAPSPSYNRVVSLAPHITELIYAAGGGEHLIATVEASDFPPDAKRLPRVGTGITLDNEHLLRLNPDLIVAWQASQAGIMLSPSLKSLDIAQTYSAPQRLMDIPDEIERFGRLLGTETSAVTTATQLRRRIQELAARYQHAAPIRVFIEVDTTPLYTIGQDPIINDMLAVCGVENLYGHSRVGAPQVNIEELLNRNPDFVLLSQTAPSLLQERLHYWQKLRLPAALRGHLYPINPDILYRPGPRLIDAAHYICQLADKLR